jgi:hypothetical protein
MLFLIAALKHFLTKFWYSFQTGFFQARSLLILLLCSLALTGCVDAKTSIHFDNPQHGILTQHIKLGSQLTTAQGWLNQLERQARKLDGQVHRLSRQELDLEIPFNGARDLVSKFNQLFSTAPAGSALGADVPAIASNLKVSTSNLLLFDRHRITYDIDLSALGIQDDSGQVLLNAGNALDLAFGVSGPWGVGAKRSPAGFNPPAQKQAGEVVWALQSGQNNHLEAVLWMPNPLGWGAAMIAGIVVLGTYYSRKTNA